MTEATRVIMIYRRFSLGHCPRGVAMALSLFASAAFSQAQNISQTFHLLPGWNSIFLEAAPANPSMAAIFSDPAIAAVAEPRIR